MKKYLFGIFAIALAIGFSAFTTKGKTAKGISLHWYEVQFDVSYPSGAILNGDAVGSGGNYLGYIDIDLVESCDSPEEVDCIRGFTTQLPTGVFGTPNEDTPDEKFERENPLD